MLAAGIVLLTVLSSVSTAWAVSKSVSMGRTTQNIGTITPTIKHVKVFKNIFLQDDWLICIHYKLDYGTILPSEDARDVYMVSLFNGSTSLGLDNSINNWGEDIVSLYINPSQASNLTWGNSYTLTIRSNPPYTLTSVSTSLSGLYLSGDQVTSRYNLGEWLKNRMQVIGFDTNQTLIAVTGAGNLVITNAGTYLCSLAIPGITGILPNIFQYTENDIIVPPESINHTYSETIQSFMMLNQADALESWRGTDLSLTLDRMEGRYAVKDAISNPMVSSQYTIQLILGNTTLPNVDLSSYDSLNFAIKSNLYSSNFSNAKVYIYDSSGNSVAWRLNFMPSPTGSFNFVDTVNLTGDEHSGSFDSHSVSNIQWKFTAATTGGFYVILDNVYVSKPSNISNMGLMTANAFKGLGEWLGVSPGLLSAMFFLFVYFITASVVYLVMGNGIAALSIAIPVVLIAAYPFGAIPLSVVFVGALVLVAMLGYFIFAR